MTTAAATATATATANGWTVQNVRNEQIFTKGSRRVWADFSTTGTVVDFTTNTHRAPRTNKAAALFAALSA